MADKRKLKKKGQDAPVQVENKATKIEYDVAKYLKNNVSTKKTKFLNHQVSYFNADKAVDLLLDSPWASGDNILFTDRKSVVLFCNKLLQHKFYHRAKKIAVTDKDLSPKKLKRKQEKEREKKEALKKKDDSEESKKEDDKTHDEGEREKTVKKDKEDPKKKKKTKIKLDMHLEQVFVDGPEAYVWMYDPIPFWYYIAGALLLFSAVAICLFPLWPPIVRKGVYYLSIAAAGFLAFILGLAVLRFIVFVFIWVLSMGRHHFWILPNLTEDVGFFASFWPLYQYEYQGSTYDKKKSKKKKSDEDSKEIESEKLSLKQETEGDDAMDSQSCVDTDKPETDGERTQDGQGTATDEYSDSEHSNSNSQTFEMVNKEELSNGAETSHQQTSAQ